MIYEVKLPKNDKVNLFTATGITAGKQLLVQNTGVTIVHLSADNDEGETPLTQTLFMTNDEGELETFAISYTQDGEITVREV